MLVTPAGANDDAKAISLDILSLELFGLGATATSQSPTGELLVGFADMASAQAGIETISSQHSELFERVEIAASDPDWTMSQRDGFTPTTVGRWHIRTPWAAPPDNTEPLHDIQIDPGAAFGHGAHPSTRLALQLLDPYLGPQTQLIDIGTGTGVLAIAAARAGAHVQAVDNSPAAIEATTHNISINSQAPFPSVTERIVVSLANASDLHVAPGQLVVANVTLDIHRLVSSALLDADHFITAGILCSQVRELQNLHPNHLAKTISSIGEWAAVEFQRADAPDPEAPSP